MKNIAILVFCCIFFALSAFGGIFDIFESEPTLSDEQMEWQLYQRNINTADPNYVLEVHEDGYKMIRAYTQKATKRGNREIPEKNMVEWGWKMTIRNKSKSDWGIKIEYKLVDKDMFEITSCSNNLSGDMIKAGQTITIRHSCKMEFENVDRVAGSSWTITPSETHDDMQKRIIESFKR